MPSLQRLILLCLALKLCAAQLKIARHTYYEAFRKTNLFINRKTFSSDENNKGNVTFVTCPEGYDHKFEKNCTVALDTRPGSRSCPVILKTSESFYFTEYLEVFPFGSTKAVIVWGEFNQTELGPNYHSDNKILIRCSVVDLNSCKNRHLKLQSSLNYTTYLTQVDEAKYVVYNDSFEIIIESAEDPEKLNKYKIDGEGNFVSKFEPWIAKPASEIFLSIATDSKLSKGYLHNDNGLEQEKRLYLLKSNEYTLDFTLHNFCKGSEKLLKEFHRDLIYQAISTAHNTVGVARSGNFFNTEENTSSSRLEVVQFDQDGNLKLNTTFNTSIHVQYLEVHNLGTGGFILLVGGCDKAINCDKPQFHLLKFTSDGKIDGSVKIAGTDLCKDQLTLQVFENEPKEYCVTYLCSNVRRSDNLSIILEKQYVDLLVNCVIDDN